LASLDLVLASTRRLAGRLALTPRHETCRPWRRRQQAVDELSRFAITSIFVGNFGSARMPMQGRGGLLHGGQVFQFLSISRPACGLGRNASGDATRWKRARGARPERSLNVVVAARGRSARNRDRSSPLPGGSAGSRANTPGCGALDPVGLGPMQSGVRTTGSPAVPGAAPPPAACSSRDSACPWAGPGGWPGRVARLATARTGWRAVKRGCAYRS